MFSVILLQNTQSITTFASTNGVRMIDGIDYSGQGTVINDTIRTGEATVNGNYVNVPTWTYGAYTYSTWDEFWAGWSDWSVNNKKYYDYFNNYGTNYKNQKHLIDVKKRTEYRYRRSTDKIPVYKTQYHTKYRKKFLWTYIYDTDVSWSTYPGNKSGWKIYSQWTSNERSGYKSGYTDFTDWRYGPPLRAIWEKPYEAYQSRETYMYRSCDLTWDANWKNESTEKVPLKYAIYNGFRYDYNLEKIVPISIANGIKWQWNDNIGSEKKKEIGFGYCSHRDITEYYLTVDQLITLSQRLPSLYLEQNNSIELYGMFSASIVDLIFGSKLSAAVLLLCTTYKGLLDKLENDELISIVDIINRAKQMNLVVRISDLYDYCIFTGETLNSSKIEINNYDKNYVSMKYSSNIFGEISYINEQELDDIANCIIQYLNQKYSFI
jgi:hypothetical protein